MRILSDTDPLGGRCFTLQTGNFYFGTNGYYSSGTDTRIDYDYDDHLFTGRIAGICDIVGFHADTVDGLQESFHEAVEDYLEACASIRKEPHKVYSGQVMFRISPEVHRKAALRAALERKSLNQWAEEVLSRVTTDA